MRRSRQQGRGKAQLLVSDTPAGSSCLPTSYDSHRPKQDFCRQSLPSFKRRKMSSSEPIAISDNEEEEEIAPGNPSSNETTPTNHFSTSTLPTLPPPHPQPPPISCLTQKLDEIKKSFFDSTPPLSPIATAEPNTPDAPTKPVTTKPADEYYPLRQRKSQKETRRILDRTNFVPSTESSLPLATGRRNTRFGKRSQRKAAARSDEETECVMVIDSDEEGSEEIIPSVGESPSRGETPSDIEISCVGESPLVGEIPSVGETPSVDETLSLGESPLVGETPSHGEIPSVGEPPTVENSRPKSESPEVIEISQSRSEVVSHGNDGESPVEMFDEIMPSPSNNDDVFSALLSKSRHDFDPLTSTTSPQQQRKTQRSKRFATPYKQTTPPSPTPSPPPHSPPHCKDNGRSETSPLAGWIECSPAVKAALQGWDEKTLSKKVNDSQRNELEITRKRSSLVSYSLSPSPPVLEDGVALVTPPSVLRPALRGKPHATRVNNHSGTDNREKGWEIDEDFEEDLPSSKNPFLNRGKNPSPSAFKMVSHDAMKPHTFKVLDKSVKGGGAKRGGKTSPVGLSTITPKLSAVDFEFDLFEPPRVVSHPGRTYTLRDRSKNDAPLLKRSWSGAGLKDGARNPVSNSTTAGHTFATIVTLASKQQQQKEEDLKKRSRQNKKAVTGQKRPDLGGVGSVLNKFGVFTRRKPRTLGKKARSQPLTWSGLDTTELEVGGARIGRLTADRVINVQIEGSEMTICLDIDNKSHRITFEILPKDISCWQMCLEAPDPLIAITLRSGRALRVSDHLCTKFHLDRGFFEPGSADESERHIILQLSNEPSPSTISSVNQALQQLKSSVVLQVQRIQLSPSEAEALLSSTAPSSSAQSQRKAPTYLTPDVGVASASPAPTRRSTRSKRGRGTSGCGFVEEVEDDPAIMVKKRPYPNRKVLIYKPSGSRLNLQLANMDLDCLEPSQYLNDKIIDFYLTYQLYSVLPEETRHRVHIFNSFFHTRLMDSSRDDKATSSTTPERMHSRVKTWTRHVDIFSKEVVILPVCDRAHWYMAVVVQGGQFDPEQAEKRYTPTVSSQTRSRKKRSLRLRKSKRSTAKISSVSTIVLSEEDSQSEQEGTTTVVPSESNNEATTSNSRPQSSQFPRPQSSQIPRPSPLRPSGVSRHSIMDDILNDCPNDSESAAEESFIKEASPDGDDDIDLKPSPEKGGGCDGVEEWGCEGVRVVPGEVLRSAAERSHSVCVVSDTPPSLLESENEDTEFGRTEHGELEIGGMESESQDMETGSVCDEDPVVCLEELNSTEQLGEGGDTCEDSDPGDPCEGGDPGAPCEGGETGDHCEDGDTGDPCEGGDPGDPCEGGEAGDPCEGGEGVKQESKDSLLDGPCILILDSLGVRRTAIVKRVRNYLTIEWQAKKPDLPAKNFDLIPLHNPEIPLQDNSSDCGVFLLQYVENLLSAMSEGRSLPSTPEQWANYEQTSRKRKEIEALILSLGGHKDS